MHEPPESIFRIYCACDNKKIHFPNAFIELYFTLHLVYFVNSQLENSTFSIFRRGLLQGEVQSPLGLNRSLLYLNQDLYNGIFRD